ncbi:glyoxalase family protein [Alteribacillus persepolensis]|uniref:Glyoxalase family protein n=1 Tax=Alteribacillus persepolensis TaxID=568899 RepID=A0A1G8EV14_9BACI|nr:ring-cleaving dioxygenase [Alteribacillus persepolensis]SDH73704.1 glyoxalase family protein [Alteribacillus persepolensis]
MAKATAGMHHITAIAGDPQVNLDFYSRVLGLRLVKTTVNFDDPGTYHLYFGNETGEPGTIMTFFPWAGAPKGRVGTGQVGITTFVVPENTLSFWEERLQQFDVKVTKAQRFEEEFLQFEDPHGLRLEIVAREEGPNSQWEREGIKKEQAIKGFGGAVLYTGAPNKTASLLEDVLGLTSAGQEDEYLRFRSDGGLGNVVDIKLTAEPRGEMGAGTVHHIAFRAKDINDQKDWQKHLADSGYHPTDIKDRDYFTSVYFREYGGLLFEIATDPPGFTRDESLEALGQNLKLPEWLEVHRTRIESILQPIDKN